MCVFSKVFDCFLVLYLKDIAFASFFKLQYILRWSAIRSALNICVTESWQWNCNDTQYCVDIDGVDSPGFRLLNLYIEKLRNWKLIGSVKTVTGQQLANQNY